MAEILSLDGIRSRAITYLNRSRQVRQNFDIGYENLISGNNTTLDRALEFREIKHFDIFLSHAFKDAEVVVGIMIELILLGYTVYVDWLIDTHADRSSVNKATAELLIRRMKQSKSLFYATTVNSPHSKWMPWELGYKHGENGKCAILPVKETHISSNNFFGREYLEVYEKVVRDRNTLWICPSVSSLLGSCVPFNQWANITYSKVQSLRSMGINFTFDNM